MKLEIYLNLFITWSNHQEIETTRKYSLTIVGCTSFITELSTKYQNIQKQLYKIGKNKSQELWETNKRIEVIPASGQVLLNWSLLKVLTVE